MDIQDARLKIGVPTPTISDLPEFSITAQDLRLEGKADPPPTQAPLGPLERFQGEFVGHGFNNIFRPNNGETIFPRPVHPAPPNKPNDNLLELNLTKESLSFTKPLGEVPNRGFENQQDIELNGRAYLQQVFDVTNTHTGLGDNAPKPTHTEPGLWMHVPRTDVDPVLVSSLCRMGSIPHGTTINAQGLAVHVQGPPKFNPVDITPFSIADKTKVPFGSQTASNSDQARLPQDLTKFIAAGTITQEILDNPNVVLEKAIVGQDIVDTIAINIDTQPQPPFTTGGGTDNIDFLQGAKASANGPNASAVKMQATFWIETVRVTLTAPAGKQGGKFALTVPPAHPGGQSGPRFEGHLPFNLTEPKPITLTYTQIQYSQFVLLDFAGLSWPHVTVGTLVPKAPLPIPAAAFN